MDAINLVITVCAVLSPANCQEKNLVFASNFSLQQCMMAAPPYIAQWVGEHPNWTAVSYMCGSREKTSDWTAQRVDHAPGRHPNNKIERRNDYASCP